MSDIFILLFGMAIGLLLGALLGSVVGKNMDHDSRSASWRSLVRGVMYHVDVGQVVNVDLCISKSSMDDDDGDDGDDDDGDDAYGGTNPEPIHKPEYWRMN